MVNAVHSYLSNPFALPLSCGLLYVALTNRWLNAERERVLRFGIVIAGLGVAQFCLVFILFLWEFIRGL